MSTKNITVRQGKLMIVAKPERMEGIRLLMERASKVPTVKQARAAQRARKDRREYPAFRDGMSTAAYVHRYYALNATSLGGWVADVRMATGRATELIGDFFEPLSTNPQFAQSGDAIEEAIA